MVNNTNNKNIIILNYLRFLLWMRVIKLEGECIEDFHHLENVRRNRLGNVMKKIKFYNHISLSQALMPTISLLSVYKPSRPRLLSYSPLLKKE